MVDDITALGDMMSGNLTCMRNAPLEGKLISWLPNVKLVVIHNAYALAYKQKVLYISKGSFITV